MKKSPTKIGRILQKQGRISAAQIGQTLDNQLVYGARFGTNLVELELASLDDVGVALSEQTGLPQPDLESLEQIDEETLSLVPPEVCARYGILPLKRTEHVLHVAMTDARDDVVEWVASLFGCGVQPYIVPELRLWFFLEQHQGIERPKRFLRVPNGQEGESRRRSYLSATVAEPEGAPLRVTERESSQQRIPRVVVAQLDTAARDAPLPKLAGLVPAATTSRTKSGAIVVRRVSTAELELGMIEPTSPAGGPIVRRRTLTWPGTSRPNLDALDERSDGALDPIEPVLAELDAATSGATVARLLVKPLCPAVQTSVLFWVRGNFAVACCDDALTHSPTQLAKLVLPLDQPSLLQWAVQMEGIVRGEGSDDVYQHRIAEFLGTSAPQEVCVAPIMLGGKVVNLLCVHSNEDGFPPRMIQDLMEVVDRGASAYRRLRERLRRETSEQGEAGG